MSASSLSYVCSKEEIGQDGNNNISELPPKEEGGLLTIDGDTLD